MGFHQLKPVSGHTGALLHEEVAGETAVMSSAAVSNILSALGTKELPGVSHRSFPLCISVLGPGSS